MIRKIISRLPLLCAVYASGATAQSLPGSEGIPQPHLAKARAEAFQDNSWSFPALLTCSAENPAVEGTLRDPPPTKAFDNLYYVGLGSVAAWAVTTNAGIIIIDTLDNSDEAKQYIAGGLQKFGLNPQDIKYVIVTHGHFDHYGGAKYLHDTYGARILMSKVDWDYMVKRNDPKAPIPAHDMDIADGGKLTLGNETISMYFTPGHTPGAVSLLIPVTDHGTPHLLSLYGGFSTRGLDAMWHAAFDTSNIRFQKIVKDAKVDGYIAEHSSNDDAMEKLFHLRNDKNPSNPFLVGLTATLRAYDVARECNLNNADVNAAMAKVAPVGQR